MRHFACHNIIVCFPLGLLVMFGCARRPPTPVTKTEKSTSPSATSHEVSGSTIRMADPAGRWSFEARAQRVETASLDGPYALQAAECRYQQSGRPPVLMRAARAQVDRSAGKAVLEGRVRLESDAWVLEAERVEYDLNEGKVLASGGRNEAPEKPNR